MVETEWWLLLRDLCSLLHCVILPTATNAMVCAALLHCHYSAHGHLSSVAGTGHWDLFGDGSLSLSHHGRLEKGLETPDRYKCPQRSRNALGTECSTGATWQLS